MRSALRFCLAAWAVALLALPGAAQEGNGLAPAPGQVRPLLVGAPLPAVSLRDMQDRPFDLAAAVAAEPTVLVFYRGHW